MWQEQMGTSIATQMLGSMRENLDLFRFRNQLALLDTRSWQSLRIVAVGRSRCIGWCARHSTVKSLPKMQLFAISTATKITMRLLILHGVVMPRMRLTKSGTGGRPQVSAMGKSSYPKRRFGYSGHQSLLVFGTQLMLQRCLGFILQQFAALPLARRIGKTFCSPLHGPGAWEANPWVVAVTFKRVTPSWRRASR